VFSCEAEVNPKRGAIVFILLEISVSWGFFFAALAVLLLNLLVLDALQGIQS